VDLLRAIFCPRFMVMVRIIRVRVDVSVNRVRVRRMENNTEHGYHLHTICRYVQFFIF